MINAANGGALGDMTPAEARNLIEKMASNSQQFSARNDAIGGGTYGLLGPTTF